MVNNLFAVGCVSGNAQCIVDARKIGAALQKGGTAQPGTLTTHHMQVFLQTSIIQQLVYGGGAENKTPGGILLLSPPPEPSMDELAQISEEVSVQAAARVHEELGRSDTWTVNGFLMMCRRVVTEVCDIKARLRNIILKPWFVGEDMPVPRQLRSRVRQIKSFT